VRNTTLARMVVEGVEGVEDGGIHMAVEEAGDKATGEDEVTMDSAMIGWHPTITDLSTSACIVRALYSAYHVFLDKFSEFERKST